MSFWRRVFGSGPRTEGPAAAPDEATAAAAQETTTATTTSATSATKSPASSPEAASPVAPRKGDRTQRVGDRRAFFRLGIQDGRKAGTDALRAVGKAARALQDGLDGVEPPPFRPPPPPPIRRPTARRPVIRPPGAIGEVAFLEACETCHRCVDACPEDAIAIATDSDGRAKKLGSPLLRVHLTPCTLCADVPCAAACPTGALVPIAPMEIRLGVAVVFTDLCLNRHQAQCQVCVDECPVGAAALRLGPSGFPEVGADACIGCGLCVMHCPTYPAAMHVVPM